MTVILAQTRFDGVAPMKWYKRDPAAALEGMAGLTIEERGFYNGVIDAYFARDGHLPDDDWLLARILGGCNPRTARKLKIALFQKQKLRVNPDGMLVPNRGEETLQEGRIYSELQANRARMRWERGEIASKIKGSLMPSVAMPLQPHKNLTLSSSLLTAARDKPEVVEPKPRTFTRAELDAAIEAKRAKETAVGPATALPTGAPSRPPGTTNGATEAKGQPRKEAKEEKRLIDQAEYMARVGNK